MPIATNTPEFSVGDCFAVGELLRLVPRELVDKALSSTNREKRRERLLPDHVVVYFVILMGLFVDLSYLVVMEKLGGVLNWLNIGTDKLNELSEPAIVQARQRVGPEPLRELFRLFAKPIATQETPGAYFHGMRVVAIDGTTFIVGDSEKNSAAYGRPVNQNGAAGMPQLRCVAVIEYATRLFIDLVFGPYEGSSEQSLAPLLISRLQPGMLCLADRLYPSFELCKMAIDAGTHFLWRAKKDIKLSPVRILADGSYEARLYLHKNRKKQKEFLTVRVIKYRLKDEPEEIRLITNIMDEAVEAMEFAKLYPARWTEETTLRELKSNLRCRNLVLRSKSPEMVEQELYGLFLSHDVVRHFMMHAANQVGIPPDGLSHKRAIYLITEHLPKINPGSDFSPGPLPRRLRQRTTGQKTSG